MAGIKTQPVEIEFLNDYGVRKAGHKEHFSPDLAAQIVQSGNAKYTTGQAAPEKETIVKTSKQKKK